MSGLRLITDRTPEAVTPDEFAAALSAHAGGVVVVTCRVDGRPWGMTVTAFASVSASPPIVLVSLKTASPAAQAIAKDGRFGVGILADEHLAVARHASAPGRPKFLEPFVDRDGRPGASPALAGALAHLDCELTESLELADHTVFFGRVRCARTSAEGTPLLYHRREYRTLADHPTTERSTSWVAN